MDVRQVVECLGNAGFTIKRKKCEWGRKYLVYRPGGSNKLMQRPKMITPIIIS